MKIAVLPTKQMHSLCMTLAVEIASAYTINNSLMKCSNLNTYHHKVASYNMQRSSNNDLALHILVQKHLISFSYTSVIDTLIVQ